MQMQMCHVLVRDMDLGQFNALDGAWKWLRMVWPCGVGHSSQSTRHLSRHFRETKSRKPRRCSTAEGPQEEGGHQPGALRRRWAGTSRCVAAGASRPRSFCLPSPMPRRNRHQVAQVERHVGLLRCKILRSLSVGPAPSPRDRWFHPVHSRGREGWQVCVGACFAQWTDWLPFMSSSQKKKKKDFVCSFDLIWQTLVCEWHRRTCINHFFWYPQTPRHEKIRDCQCDLSMVVSIKCVQFDNQATFCSASLWQLHNSVLKFLLVISSRRSLMLLLCFGFFEWWNKSWSVWFPSECSRRSG